jgi:hypothetical protein
MTETTDSHVILSLDAGVQPTALALMSVRGELSGFRRPVAAIVADTGLEPRGIYVPKMLTFPEMFTFTFTLPTYRHPATSAFAAEPGSPLADKAEDSNLGVPEDACCGLTDLSRSVVSKEARFDSQQTVAKAQVSA